MTLPIETVRVLFERELDAFTREIEAYPMTTASSRRRPASRTPRARSRCTLPEISSSSSAIGSADRATCATAMPNSRRAVSRGPSSSPSSRGRKQAVHAALTERDPASVPSVFPDKVAGKTMTSEVFVLHLVAHLAYHLGQVDYHRRITTGDAKTVDTVSVPALPGIS